MLNTRLEVVKKVIENYANATDLSKRKWSGHTTCFYSHEANGVGCGIGTLLPKEKAQELEDHFGGVVISNVLERDRGVELIGAEINLTNISTLFLKKIQEMHDGAVAIAEFRDNLELLKDQIITEEHFDNTDYT